MDAIECKDLEPIMCLQSQLTNQFTSLSFTKWKKMLHHPLCIKGRLHAFPIIFAHKKPQHQQRFEVFA
jgi:hypothetical protein